ncbi:chemotaxis protein CheY [Rhodonellum psychrophilum GCM71 = DSM 17998]|uniref:Chemotaxis protein CheY n=2 Tax=Rhodonellum TaxID=336827 RepID=U5C5A3_9BACT|nr:MULTISPECIES: LytTR family DNA-binding domain-containing protein [Rhodonellum]ERM83352.1 chemotaxis protein CheY [Rhodonellum psychrophilum GCM71 = DSM 17998]MDO9551157.1 LytTR family DNA-binding domain-containing protein [Rhodonellum sp.]SDZ38449.1 two component transcriptional regulator, LytTR family [Rhodonellum ikkaensis]
MKIKCIAVDDEPLALSLISRFIEQTSFLILLGKFENAIDALGFINQNEVDLIFLDIQMPDLSGMELARVLDGKTSAKKPRIIFTTAYNQFAIEGYKVDALDYLLKPFSYEEFLKASTKAYQYLDQQANPVGESVNTDAYIFLKVEYQLVKIMLKEITHVEAYKDYVKVFLLHKPNPILSLTSLKSMEDMLPSDRFMRIHRSYIIALDHIDSIARNTVNIGNTQITVSENYKDNFMQFLSKWIG